MAETNSTEKKRSDIGAGWLKSGVDSTTNEKWSFVSLSLTLDGKTHDLIMRKNKYKESGTSQPDYRIYPNERAQKTSEKKRETPKPVVQQEEPF